MCQTELNTNENQKELPQSIMEKINFIKEKLNEKHLEINQKDQEIENREKLFKKSYKQLNKLEKEEFKKTEIDCFHNSQRDIENFPIKEINIEPLIKDLKYSIGMKEEIKTDRLQYTDNFNLDTISGVRSI